MLAELVLGSSTLVVEAEADGDVDACWINEGTGRLFDEVPASRLGFGRCRFRGSIVKLVR